MIKYNRWLCLALIVSCWLVPVRHAFSRECTSLLYAMMDCRAHKCVAQLHGTPVTYEVLGISDGNCKYSERDESGFALCSVSQNNYPAISGYIVQLFTKSGGIDIEAVARLKAETCDFYRTHGNSYIKKGKELSLSDVREIERAVERRVRKDEIKEIRSMFFEGEDIEKLREKNSP
ncbi:MAG: hypothetical protein ACTJLL_01540 [Anaplasma sp.]